MREGERKREPNPVQVRTFFEQIAERYDVWYRTPLGALVDAVEKEALFALAGVARGDTALDVGCGTGNYTLELARRGAAAVGLDPSPQMLGVARGKAHEQGLPVELIVGLVEDLPFSNHTFDLLICVTALEFTMSPIRALDEMLRTLKPGGRLILGVLNAWSIWALARRFARKDSIYAHAHFFSPLELAALLRPHGAATWRTAVFLPPWYVRPDPRLANASEFLGRLILKPFGAFIAARVVKGE